MAQEFVLGDESGVRWSNSSLEVDMKLYESGSNESSLGYFIDVLSQARHGRWWCRVVQPVRSRLRQRHCTTFLPSRTFAMVGRPHIGFLQPLLACGAYRPRRVVQMMQAEIQKGAQARIN